MRYGAMISGATVDEVVDDVRRLSGEGYSSAWLTDAFGFEPLTVLAIAGREVAGIELGTAVVRTHPRHPVQLAQQALTANEALGGRLSLGIGPSHRSSIEAAFGLSYDRPLRHVREFLEVLGPLLRDGSVSHHGAVYDAEASLYIDAGRPCQVLVGALGPGMLRLAGVLADGTITYLVGPRTLNEVTAPVLTAAAAEAGRAVPRIVAMLGVCVTDDPGSAAERMVERLGPMATLPAYAAALEREQGAPLIAGSDDEVAAALSSLEAAGITDLVALRATRRGSDDDLATEALMRRLRTEAAPGGQPT